MKFVLTGATGFIGSHLQKYLHSQGHLVTTINRGTSQNEMVQALQSFKPDVVIHLASCFIAEHKPSDVENLIQSNVLFGAHLLEAMMISECRNLINTGTTWQHFRGDRNQPVCLYSATKNAFEEIIKYYISAENFKVINLKICDSYGPEDNRGKLVSKLIESLKTGQEFKLSPGEQRINLVHVNDIVKAFYHAAKLIQDDQNVYANSAYTLATDTSLSIKEIVNLIESISGKKLNVAFGARPYRKREVMTPEILDPILPNWKAAVSIEKGLKELIHGC